MKRNECYVRASLSRPRVECMEILGNHLPVDVDRCSKLSGHARARQR